MFANDPNLQRLRWGGWNILGRAWYWAGPEHLLLVEVMGFTERSRHIRIEDIESVLVSETPRRFWFNFLFGLVGGGSLAGLVTVGSGLIAQPEVTGPEWVGVGMLSLVVAAAGAAIVRNTFLGRGVVVTLNTGIQHLRLPSLNREPQARQLIDHLEERRRSLGLASAQPPADSGAVIDPGPPSAATPPA